MAPQRNTGADAEAELPEYAGQYHLEERLGSGGMGVVHLARSESGLRLAVKVVHAEFARDPEFRGRFRQEIAAARRVSGAFTAPVVDADADGGRPWMATLFIPGPTLAEHVKRNGPMPTGQLRRLMAGLAEALRDIHRVGVVHRDLKPSNVLLADDGPKVIDFGISRPSDSELRTETGKLIGTPPFMAPEQFRRPREVGPAADIFALGSVMVHAATGRGPFDSDSPYVVAYQVVHDEPDLTGVPENLAPFVARCLAKEPEDRPTPDELMRELRSVAASYDTQAFIPAQRAMPSSPTGADGPADGSREAGTGDTDADADDWRFGAGAFGAEGSGAGRLGELGSRADGGGGGSSGPGSGGPPRRGEPRAGLARGLAGRRRLLLVAGAVALAVAGGLVSHQLFVEDGGAPSDGRPQSASTVVEAWDSMPAADPSGSGGTDPSGADGPDGARAAPVSGEPFGTPQCAYASKQLFCAQPGLVSALDPADGRVRWRHTSDKRGGPSGEPGGPVPPPAVSGGLVHSVTHEGRRLEALDPATGRTRWKLDLSAYNGVGHAGGTVLLTGADGTLTGLDGASGEKRWSHRLPGHLSPSVVSFPGNGPAYATSLAADGSRTHVTAVDPATGEVRWDTRLDGQLTPVGTRRGALVLTAADLNGETNAVVRYDPRTDASRRVPLAVALPQAQAAVRGDTGYLLATGGGMVAVDLDTLKQRWRLETSVSRGSMPVADAQHVYFTSADGRLLAVDARVGRLVGQTSIRLGAHSDRVVAQLPAPSVGGGRVFAGAPDGTVFAVPGGDPAGW
ncbi:serine/threonine-protein kinase [Streptomyces sp. NPDC005301]|uniref:serine/threonine-protein kinase n=1 Tax=Streptomyces sp. NPDC005301 TaxID=3156874 RepID=UPI0033A90108